MKVSSHIAVSAAASAAVYLVSGSIAAAIGCLIGGVLIDLDHVVDYVLNYGPAIRPARLFHAFKYESMKHIVVFLHSWELVFAALVALWLTGWEPFAAGLAGGAGLHLLLDTLFNKHSAPAYFISFRLFHGFSGRHFYGEKEYARRASRLAADKS